MLPSKRATRSRRRQLQYAQPTAALVDLLRHPRLGGLCTSVRLFAVHGLSPTRCDPLLLRAVHLDLLLHGECSSTAMGYGAFRVFQQFVLGRADTKKRES